ncbi:MAG: hypothetical protein WCH99_19515 [Verrucomicrobiota bacterium]
MGSSVTVETAPEALSAEAVRRAQCAVSEYASCFWMRQPAVILQNRADVELVVRRLRENGGLAAWRAAREIESCL